MLKHIYAGYLTDWCAFRGLILHSDVTCRAPAHVSHVTHLGHVT